MQISKHYDYLIVGGGLYGSLFAYLAKTFENKNSLIIEKRPNVGGNLYCENIEGINVHSYGAHIFHTNNRQVWNFVNSIVRFEPFINQPIAVFHDKAYHLPFNMNTFSELWGFMTVESAQRTIKSQTDKEKALIGGVEPRNLEEQALCMVGRDIYETLIKEYTEKQWGRPCDQLPASIIKRLPLRFTYDNNYFNDKFQGIPTGGGYNNFINALLKGVDVMTGVDYFDNKELFDKQADKVIYTGPLDRLFGYKFGKLDWRTLRFEHKVIDKSVSIGNAVINRTDKTCDHTREIEHKMFDVAANPFSTDKTVVSFEYPQEYKDGLEPYYPINDNANEELANKYKALLNGQDKIELGGRLAEYKYYDMSVIVENLLRRFGVID